MRALLRVVVTGAAQGIGREIAEAFCSAGAAVAVLDRDGARAARVVDRWCKTGARAIAVPVDVADEASVAAAFAEVQARFGGVDVLVNNAAVFSTLSRRDFDRIELDEWRRVMAVNVDGAFLCARAVAAGMKAAGWGRIVNVSSNTVTLGRTGFLHYVTSKAAVIGLTNALARELGAHGITVNAVMPSLTRTEVEFQDVPQGVYDEMIARQCIKRTGRPADIAAAVLFLASNGADFITGQTVAVDGGAVHR
jgi:3-oxoacyl-[acyl-carrier protein] reductase